MNGSRYSLVTPDALLEEAIALVGAVESGSASLSPSDSQRLGRAVALIDAALAQLDTQEVSQ